MQGVIVIDSAVNCTDGKGGSVSRIVIDPRTNRLGYIEVHRGLIFTHDHCVPAGSIQAASPEAVELKITTKELEEMSPLQAKDPATGLYQRCIPEHYISLGKRTALEGDQRRVIGHFQGVVVGPQVQVEAILSGAAPTDRIPISDIAAFSEDRLRIQRGARAEQPAPAAAPVSSAAEASEVQREPAAVQKPSQPEPTAQPVSSQPEAGRGQYGLTTQKILDFMRNHPGDLFAPEDVCEAVDTELPQTRVALETLFRDGMIDKESTAGGVNVYVYRQR